MRLGTRVPHYFERVRCISAHALQTGLIIID